MYTTKVYARLASCLQARLNCAKMNNREWYEKHTDTINELIENYLPHGSGFDCGCKFDYERSKPDRLVITTEYHRMDDNGFYDGWTSHDVIVTPSLSSWYDIRITGKDRNGWKEYAYQEFDYCLTQEITLGV
jgi:hypothetical protein